jgi:hypothetical protein
LHRTTTIFSIKSLCEGEFAMMPLEKPWSSYWQPAITGIGAMTVAVATLVKGEHSLWVLSGAALAAIGAFACALDQIRLQKQIKDQIIALSGGASFAFIEFVHLAGAPAHTYSMCINHRGNHTITNLSISLINLVGLIKNPPIEKPVVVPSLEIGNLTPGSRKVVRDIVVPPGEFRFQITFQASNGAWTQVVVGAPVGNTHAFAIQIWRSILPASSSVLVRQDLYEHIDSNFPLGATDVVDWSFGSIKISE